MFRQSAFRGDISGWDVTNVENMSYMFSGINFSGDLSRWSFDHVEEPVHPLSQFHDSPLGYTRVLQGLCPLPADRLHVKDFQQLQALADGLGLNTIETAKMVYHHITGNKPLIPETNFSMLAT